MALHRQGKLSEAPGPQPVRGKLQRGLIDKFARRLVTDELGAPVEPLIPPRASRPQGSGRWGRGARMGGQGGWCCPAGAHGGICRRGSGRPRPPPIVGSCPGPKPGDRARVRTEGTVTDRPHPRVRQPRTSPRSPPIVPWSGSPGRPPIRARPRRWRSRGCWPGWRRRRSPSPGPGPDAGVRPPHDLPPVRAEPDRTAPPMTCLVPGWPFAGSWSLLPHPGLRAGNHHSCDAVVTASEQPMPEVVSEHLADAPGRRASTLLT